MKRTIMLAAGMALILTGSVLAQDTLRVGGPAPTFFLPALDGSKFFLSEQIVPQGRKAVLLDFYTTWCQPCQRELPLLDSLVRRYPADSLVFVIVDVGEHRDTVAKYFDSRRYPWMVLLDRFNAVADKYGVKSFPALVLVDRQGIVRYIGRGFDQRKGLAGLAKAMDNAIYSGRSKKKINR